MIEIVAYQERWPAEFEAIANPIRQALGDLAVSVDHIGSTSVPGLAAKDIIDVQVTLPNFDLLDQVTAALATLGYTVYEHITEDHRPPGGEGPDSDWEKRLFKPPATQRPTNLHVRAVGRANQRYALLFRDYLRAHPLAAAAYAEVKRRLAQYHPEDREAYTLIKDPVCDLIMNAAEAWVKQTGWQVGGAR